MSFVDQDLVEYLRNTQPYMDGILGEIQKEALEKNVPICPPEVARLLCTLLSMKRPKRILEIGCAVGFSSGLMSRYLASGGHITTIDRFDVMIDHARENFKKLGITDVVTLIEGDALDILPMLSDKFDVIFLDAAKGQYLQMMPYCLKLLNVDGILIADDVLQEGRIAMDRYAVPRRQRTIHTRMKEFLYTMSNTEGIESSILTIGDGVLLAHKTEKYKENHND